MSNKPTTIEISEEANKHLQKLQDPSETDSETVQRVLEDAATDSTGMYSLFTLVAMTGLVLWLVSFVTLGASVSNAVGGIFLASTLFWVIWKEIKFQSI